jgi:hypothetical protein
MNKQATNIKDKPTPKDPHRGLGDPIIWGDVRDYIDSKILEGRTVVFMNADGSVSPIYQGDTLCLLNSLKQGSQDL